MFNASTMLQVASRLVSRLSRVVVVSVGMQASFSCVVVGQVIPDTSLGMQRSVIDRQQTQINDLSADVISGGAARGEHLFHSFREFNVGNQQQLYFAPDSDISAIFTRVTGDNASRILGTLGVLGEADLFLLNPNGIFFGENAQLALGGSFLASTADEIAFSEAFKFSVSTSTAPPDALLTIQPSALIFNRLFNHLSPATIESQAALEVAAGERIQLVGGDVLLWGRSEEQRSMLTASGGLIELGGLASNGQVEFSSEGGLQFLVGASRADVALSQAGLFVDAAGNGEVNIMADNLLLEESEIVAGYQEGQENVRGRAGDVALDATGNLFLRGSLVNNNLSLESSGRTGDISLTAGGDLLISDSEIVSRLEGMGEIGSVEISAVGDAVLSASAIRNNVRKTGIGEVGGINLRARSLRLDSPNPDGRQTLISTDTFGQGDAGDLLIEADALTVVGPGVSGPSGITSNADGGGAVGNAGDITLNIRGPIVMTARGKVSATVTRGATGLGGDIDVRAESLQLSDVSFIQARNNRSTGRPGNIDITLDGALILTGNSFVDTRVSATSVVLEDVIEGESGQIFINAETVRLSDQGAIIVTSFGGGDAGDIEIVADLIEIDDPYISGEISSASGLFSRSRPNTEGRGGNIVVQARDLRINENAVISTQTDNDFPGGDIQITADRIFLTDGGQLLASSSGTGEAGNIDIMVRDEIVISGRDENYALQVQDATERFGLGFIGDLRRILNREGEDGFAPSGIFLQSLGETADAGAAGSLMIAALEENVDLILADGAEINAETVSTTGGNLTFSDLGVVLLRGGSSITAEADAVGKVGDGGTGNGGNITFAMPDGVILATATEDNDIVANAFEGNGGNITISSRSIVGLEARRSRTSGSDISASSAFGSDGQIRLETLNVTPDQGLVAQAPAFVDQSRFVDRRCLADTRQGRSSFVITGAGGIPPSPRDIVRSESAGLLDFGSVDADEPLAVSSSEDDSVIPEFPDAEVNAEAIDVERASADSVSVLEAQGWERKQNGEISLIAYQPDIVTTNQMGSGHICSQR